MTKDDAEKLLAEFDIADPDCYPDKIPPTAERMLQVTEQGGTMAFAWVIEKGDSEKSRPIYFTGKRHPAQRWSEPGDNSAAVRFARKEDAERIAELAGFYDPNPTHRICEHGWQEISHAR